jgi:hypothetical protein
MIIIIWLVFGLFFALISAGMANRRGRNGALWGVLGFFIGIFAILILAIIGKSAEISHTVQLAHYPSETPAISKFDEIAKLKALLDSGVLTQAEFEAEKQKILS